MGVEYLLEMKDINKAFPGVQALENVKLNVKPGEVHALMGENGAGKSTLMKCLFGNYQMDSGEVIFNGKSVRFSGPKQALDSGIAMVQQELEQVLQRSVMDNIWLGRYPCKGMQVDDKKMHMDTMSIIESLQVKINPRTKVGDLSVSMRQMVDIMKAVSYDAKIIVMDEPTSSLTEKETELLFDIIKRLKEKGCGIIYISHKIDEILKISDRVTVMRDGKWVACEAACELTADRIVKLMVNREMNNRFPPKTNVPGEIVMKVENLTSYYEPRCENVSFELKAGEILGVGGLVGARRTELLETIFGLRRKASGKVILHGKEIHPKGSKVALKDGIVLVTEERRATGIFPMLDIRSNTIISSLKKHLNKMNFLSMKKVEESTKWSIDAMRIKTPSMRTLLTNLSGGNQQKVILGRCLLNKPEILLLDEPTRGIDVGAKYEIYQLIIDLANKGKAIIFVSSEMPELLGIADRILVMSNGHLAGITEAGETDQTQIMHLATKHLKSAI